MTVIGRISPPASKAVRAASKRETRSLDDKSVKRLKRLSSLDSIKESATGGYSLGKAGASLQCALMREAKQSTISRSPSFDQKSIGQLSKATPETAGITAKHLKVIKELCKEWNVGLFVRPSTAATMRLIQEGFATKSTDVHHKSSDWGLMAGFVPCDAYFSKKRDGENANRAIKSYGLLGT